MFRVITVRELRSSSERATAGTGPAAARTSVTAMLSATTRGRIPSVYAIESPPAENPPQVGGSSLHHHMSGRNGRPVNGCEAADDEGRWQLRAGSGSP